MNAREKARIRRLNIKSSVLSHYGNGRCACVNCDFDDLRALSIDHISDNGAEHRKQLNRSSIYEWLVSNDFPDGYQTLCMNCQFIKRYSSKPSFKRIKTVAGRVRVWVELRETPFYTWEVMNGLGLESGKNPSVRQELHRLKVTGVIKGDNFRPGYFKKLIKPVKVFS